MQTLTYGYELPETNDKGSVFFPALENNITQLNDHDHDGSNSARLTAQSITGVSQTITSGSWSATSGGTYRQLVTMPPGTTFDDYGIVFRLASGGSSGHQVNLSVEKVSASTFYVYINDNSVDVKILYLV